MLFSETRLYTQGCFTSIRTIDETSVSQIPDTALFRLVQNIFSRPNRYMSVVEGAHSTSLSLCAIDILVSRGGRDASLLFDAHVRNFEQRTEFIRVRTCPYDRNRVYPTTTTHLSFTP